VKRDFDWYWRPPFSDPSSPDYFERNDWWTECGKDVPQFAAEYEYLRRHPIVGMFMRSRSRKRKSKLVEFLCQYGQAIWPRLTSDARERFRDLCRETLVLNLSAKAIDATEPIKHDASGLMHEDAATKGKRNSDRQKQRVSRLGEMILARVQRLAKIESLKGKIILSVPWDSEHSLDEIASQVTSVVVHWREKNFAELDVTSKPPTRDTTDTRLKKLREFEWSEMERFWDFKKAPRGRGKEKQRRDPQLPRKYNQNKRRAFQRLCEKIGDQFL
jgi:hypothetical protein